MEDSDLTLNTDVDSSSAAEPISQNSNSSEAPDVKVNSEESSAEGGQKKDVKSKGSLLDAIKSVVKEPKSEDSSPEGKAQEKGKSTEAKDPVKEKAEKQKADEDARFDKHPRFQQLLKERDSLKGAANEYREIEKFVKTNNLNYSEVAEGFKVMAALKNNPMLAKELLAPVWNQLSQFSGETLPQDLHSKVQQGIIDQQTASELARTRNQQALYASHAQQLANSQQMAEQSRAQAEMQSHSVNSVNEWVKTVKSRDPDFDKKESFIVDRVNLMRVTNPNPTPDQALAMAKQAYEHVNAQTANLIPRRQPIAPSPSSTLSSNGNTRPVMKSTKDAIRYALKNTY